MGWFRFDDKAIDHPKFLSLSDGAFRLWIEGGSYCNRHLTDGLILRAALNGFRYTARKRIDEIVEQRLWEPVGDGFQMHNYRKWNDSKDVVETKKEASRERVRKWREKSVSSHVSNALQHTHSHSGVVKVLGIPERRSEDRSENRPDPFTDETVTERAGRFMERYELLYKQHRGANYLVRPGRDYQSAVGLCATWDDDVRLDKIASIFLTTDNDFAEKGSRTIPQFAGLASWCDGKLTEWERRQK